MTDLKLVKPEPLKLKNEVIYRRETKEALDKLSKANFDFKTAYNIKRIRQHCDQNFRKLQSSFKEMITKYSEKDEKGNLIQAGGPDSYKIKEEFLNDYHADFEKLLSSEFELPKCNRITVDSIAHQPELLSAQDIEALEALIDIVD